MAVLISAISFIEDYIRDHILPLYGNTHTTTSRTGLQSTCLREEARHIIHRCVNGSPDDVVIFAGSGFTGAQVALLRTLGFDMKGRNVCKLQCESRVALFSLRMHGGCVDI